MNQKEEIIYPDEPITYDSIYLKYLLLEERDAFVSTYVQDNYEEISHSYEVGLMLLYPYFGNKILDDYEMSNIEKQKLLLKNLVYGDSKGGKIVLVDGAKGGGKTGFGAWILDEIHKLKPKNGYFYVSNKDNSPVLPDWIHKVKDDGELPNNCIAFIDEGAIQLSSRRSMNKENKDASDRLVVLRHRGITLIILVQNIKMVDANVRRLADIRALKFGIPFGTDETTDKQVMLIRKRLQPRSNREVFIEIPSKKLYFKFSHPLPAWWDDEKVSKSFANVKLQTEIKEVTAVKKKERAVHPY